MTPNIKLHPVFQQTRSGADLQKKLRKKSSIVGTIIEQAKKLRSSNAFQNSKSAQ